MYNMTIAKYILVRFLVANTNNLILCFNYHPVSVWVQI